MKPKQNTDLTLLRDLIISFWIIKNQDYFHWFSRLKEWVAKQAEKEKEREEKRKERMERRRAVPNHKFDDPLYDKQRTVVAENQVDALQIGELL